MVWKPLLRLKCVADNAWKLASAEDLSPRRSRPRGLRGRAPPGRGQTAGSWCTGAGNPSGTLERTPNEALKVGDRWPWRRHRLDRDTQLMVLAKGERRTQARRDDVVQASRTSLRTIGRGRAARTGTIDSPVGRAQTTPPHGRGRREAGSHDRVLAAAAEHTMLGVRLETGRTHQIRVHLSAIGHPVYADPLYGSPVPGHRLWLHAEQLSFEHPVGGEALEFHSEIPEDLRGSARGLDRSLAFW